MKKIIPILITIYLLAGPCLSIANSGEIQLKVKDFECVEDGKIVVHYGIISTFDFEYSNVTLGFKLVEEGKTVACKKLKVTVPEEADGSDINEVIINEPCAGRSYSLKSAVFYYIKQYKIDEWFSDCE